ncbi:MAG: DUF413 domain-containing protein [Pseudoalteromonas spongiae]|uniref:Macrodomain Ori protein n=1 Tax=Pseudoalteromonas spongiae TaxID=298657 RepID=A0ABU8EYY4_9GAMM|nr:DUF413 domain-containing protein [Pseudomonadota bacterium]
MTNMIRAGRRKFYDDEHFAGGIERSGFFTISEANFLVEYGDTLNGLSAGNLNPESAAESEFVACMQSNIASNSYEVKLWRKYIKAVHSVTHRASANSSRTEQHYSFEGYDEA